MSTSESGSPDVSASISWQGLRNQLDELATQLAHGFDVSPEEHAQLLNARSKSWEAIPSIAAQAQLSVLAFTLGDETYGIEMHHVDEVMPLRHVTSLPGTPAFLRGIVNVRGRIVSVVDLRVLFDMPKRGLADRNHLLILRNDEMEFGLLADRVIGVQPISAAGLQTEMTGLSGLRRALLKGISDQHWTILDGTRLLMDPALRIDEIS
ncbi:chemotaxis protein CheW [Chitinimonas naiadis]